MTIFLHNPNQQLPLQLLCKMIFLQFKGEKSSVLLLCDKNPIYSIFVKRLLSIFPDARFIHVVRDPRDVVNGFKKRFLKKNTFFLAHQWLRFNKKVDMVKQKEPQRFYTIKYEDMVINPGKMLESLCAFLHIPFNTLMLQHNFAEKVKAYGGDEDLESFKKRHEGLLKPINASNIEKWKVEMSAPDILITEKITGSYAHIHYGYSIFSKSNNIVSPLQLKIFINKLRVHNWEVLTKLRVESPAFNSLWNFIKGKPTKERKKNG